MDNEDKDTSTPEVSQEGTSPEQASTPTPVSTGEDAQVVAGEDANAQSATTPEGAAPAQADAATTEDSATPEAPKQPSKGPAWGKMGVLAIVIAVVGVLGYLGSNTLFKGSFFELKDKDKEFFTHNPTDAEEFFTAEGVTGYLDVNIQKEDITGTPFGEFLLANTIDVIDDSYFGGDFKEFLMAKGLANSETMNEDLQKVFDDPASDTAGLFKNADNAINFLGAEYGNNKAIVIKAPNRGKVKKFFESLSDYNSNNSYHKFKQTNVLGAFEILSEDEIGTTITRGGQDITTDLEATITGAVEAPEVQYSAIGLPTNNNSFSVQHSAASVPEGWEYRVGFSKDLNKDVVHLYKIFDTESPYKFDLSAPFLKGNIVDILGLNSGEILEVQIIAVHETNEGMFVYNQSQLNQVAVEAEAAGLLTGNPYAVKVVDIDVVPAVDFALSVTESESGANIVITQEDADGGARVPILIYSQDLPTSTSGPQDDPFGIVVDAPLQDLPSGVKYFLAFEKEDGSAWMQAMNVTSDKYTYYFTGVYVRNNLVNTFGITDGEIVKIRIVPTDSTSLASIKKDPTQYQAALDAFPDLPKSKVYMTQFSDAGVPGSEPEVRLTVLNTDAMILEEDKNLNLLVEYKAEGETTYVPVNKSSVDPLKNAIGFYNSQWATQTIGEVAIGSTQVASGEGGGLVIDLSKLGEPLDVIAPGGEFWVDARIGPHADGIRSDKVHFIVETPDAPMSGELTDIRVTGPEFVEDDSMLSATIEFEYNNSGVYVTVPPGDMDGIVFDLFRYQLKLTNMIATNVYFAEKTITPNYTGHYDLLDISKEAVNSSFGEIGKDFKVTLDFTSTVNPRKYDSFSRTFDYQLVAPDAPGASFTSSSLEAIRLTHDGETSKEEGLAVTVEYKYAGSGTFVKNAPTDVGTIIFGVPEGSTTGIVIEDTDFVFEQEQIINENSEYMIALSSASLLSPGSTYPFIAYFGENEEVIGISEISIVADGEVFDVTSGMKCTDSNEITSIRLVFNQPIDMDTAEDPGNYSVIATHQIKLESLPVAVTGVDIIDDHTVDVHHEMLPNTSFAFEVTVESMGNADLTEVLTDKAVNIVLYSGCPEQLPEPGPDFELKAYREAGAEVTDANNSFTDINANNNVVFKFEASVPEQSDPETEMNFYVNFESAQGGSGIDHFISNYDKNDDKPGIIVATADGARISFELKTLIEEGVIEQGELLKFTGFIEQGTETYVSNSINMSFTLADVQEPQGPSTDEVEIWNSCLDTNFCVWGYNEFIVMGHPDQLTEMFKFVDENQGEGSIKTADFYSPTQAGQTGFVMFHDILSGIIPFYVPDDFGYESVKLMGRLIKNTAGTKYAQYGEMPFELSASTMPWVTFDMGEEVEMQIMNNPIFKGFTSRIVEFLWDYTQITRPDHNFRFIFSTDQSTNSKGIEDFLSGPQVPEGPQTFNPADIPEGTPQDIIASLLAKDGTTVLPAGAAVSRQHGAEETDYSTSFYFDLKEADRPFLTREGKVVHAQFSTDGTWTDADKIIEIGLGGYDAPSKVTYDQASTLYTYLGGDLGPEDTVYLRFLEGKEVMTQGEFEDGTGFERIVLQVHRMSNTLAFKFAAIEDGGSNGPGGVTDIPEDTEENLVTRLLSAESKSELPDGVTLFYEDSSEEVSAYAEIRNADGTLVSQDEEVFVQVSLRSDWSDLDLMIEGQVELEEEGISSLSRGTAHNIFSSFLPTIHRGDTVYLRFFQLDTEGLVSGVSNTVSFALDQVPAINNGGGGSGGGGNGGSGGGGGRAGGGGGAPGGSGVDINNGGGAGGGNLGGGHGSSGDVVVIGSSACHIVAADSTTFSDLEKTDPEYDAVQFLASTIAKISPTSKNEPILVGYPLTERLPNVRVFRGANQITRAEIVKLAFVTNCIGEDPSAISRVNFSDIAGHWAVNLIKTASASKIVSGYIDGRFGPDDPVTRAQIVKILLEIKGDPLMPFDPSVASDIKASDWPAEYVTTASKEGLFEGIESFKGSQFQPNKTITRAEAVQLIYNMYKNMSGMNIELPSL